MQKETALGRTEYEALSNLDAIMMRKHPDMYFDFFILIQSSKMKKVLDGSMPYKILIWK